MHIFNRITYQAPESVELEFTLGGVGSRAWALLIDYHILGFTLVAFLIVWSVFSYQLVQIGTNLFKSYDIGLWLVAITLLVMFFKPLA